MQIDQVQRRDIDSLIESHISLIIDESRGIDSPYVYVISSICDGNNWVKADDIFIKYNATFDDKVSFPLPSLQYLSEKIISKLELFFDITGTCKITTIGLSNENISREIAVDVASSEDMLIDCDLLGFSIDELQTIFSDESTLTVGLSANNQRLAINNCELRIHHTDVLQEEIDTVENRLNFNNDKNNALISRLGYFTIDENGDLWVELPVGVDNFYTLDENGDLWADIDFENLYTIQDDGELTYG